MNALGHAPRPGRAKAYEARLLAAAGSGTPTQVLDIGCGAGRLLAAAARAWPASALTGVDPNRKRVAEARRRVPAAAVVVGTAESLPIADGSVDVAYATMTLHHWMDPKAGLAEAARVLRPGGRLIVVDYRPAWWSWWTHGKVLSAETVADMLRAVALVPTAPEPGRSAWTWLVTGARPAWAGGPSGPSRCQNTAVLQGGRLA